MTLDGSQIIHWARREIAKWPAAPDVVSLYFVNLFRHATHKWTDWSPPPPHDPHNPQVNYSISLVIGNIQAVEAPLINITRSGLIPRHEQGKRIAGLGAPPPPSPSARWAPGRRRHTHWARARCPRNLIWVAIGGAHCSLGPLAGPSEQTKIF